MDDATRNLLIRAYHAAQPARFAPSPPSFFTPRPGERSIRTLVPASAFKPAN